MIEIKYFPPTIEGRNVVLGSLPLDPILFSHAVTWYWSSVSRCGNGVLSLVALFDDDPNARASRDFGVSPMPCIEGILPTQYHCHLGACKWIRNWSSMSLTPIWRMWSWSWSKGCLLCEDVGEVTLIIHVYHSKRCEDHLWSIVDIYQNMSQTSNWRALLKDVAYQNLLD
jgi:hypothetical protein